MKALEILRKAELETNCGKLYSDSGTAIATEKEIDAAIAELEALKVYKTCDGCKHREDYADTFTCFHLDNIVDTSPQEPYGIYIQDANTLCCINYKPKDEE